MPLLGGIARRDFDGDPAAAEVVPPADLIAAEWRVALRRVGAVLLGEEVGVAAPSFAAAQLAPAGRTSAATCLILVRRRATTRNPTGR